MYYFLISSFRVTSPPPPYSFTGACAFLLPASDPQCSAGLFTGLPPFGPTCPHDEGDTPPRINIPIIPNHRSQPCQWVAQYHHEEIRTKPTSSRCILQIWPGCYPRRCPVLLDFQPQNENGFRRTPSSAL